MKPIWEAVVTIKGEQPEDAERIVKDVARLVSYDRNHGRIGCYAYYLKANNELTVEYTPRKKKAKRTFRQFAVGIDILNRRWEQRTTPGGLPVMVPVRIND